MTLVLGESFTEELAEGHYLDTTLKHSRAGSLPLWSAFHCGSEPARDEARSSNADSETYFCVPSSCCKLA